MHQQVDAKALQRPAERCRRGLARDFVVHYHDRVGQALTRQGAFIVGRR
jgi:hypothetical protein